MCYIAEKSNLQELKIKDLPIMMENYGVMNDIKQILTLFAYRSKS